MMITLLLTLLASYMAYRAYKQVRYIWAMFWALMVGWNLHVTLLDLFL